MNLKKLVINSLKGKDTTKPHTITVKLSEIANHPTMRMDAQYWIRKKNVQSNTKRKVQREKNRSKHSK